MDQGKRPTPPPNHQGEPPALPTMPDVRVPGAIIAGIFVLVSAGGGGLIYLLDGDFAESMIAGGVLGITYLFALLVQALRGF